jgi:predicted N-acetyltransferase YhbS
LRLTEIMIGGEGGALLLGPLVVATEAAGQGYGRALVSNVLEKAKDSGIQLVVLVGDEPYYGRFGFEPVPPGQIVFPGPVDPARILAAELAGGARSRYRGSVKAAL